MKSKKLVFILNIILLNTFVGISWAQQTNSIASEIEEVKAELLQEASKRREREEYHPIWQGNLEALQQQVNDLMAQNARLSIQQRELESELPKLETEVNEKEKINQDLSIKVNGLKELSDEKVWDAKVSAQDREALKRLSIKNNELMEYDAKIKYLEQKISVARSKLRLMGVNDVSDQLLALQEERDLLEAKLLSQSQHEKELMQKILQIKSEKTQLDPNVAALRNEIEELSREIAGLEDKQRSIAGKSGFTVKEQIEILTKQKEDLSSENDRLLAKIHEYQKSEKLGIDNKRVKELVEQISAVDAANIQLNEEIGYLRENIAILRTRVKRMEYQADKLKAMKGQ